MGEDVACHLLSPESDSLRETAVPPVEEGCVAETEDSHE